MILTLYKGEISHFTTEKLGTHTPQSCDQLTAPLVLGSARHSIMSMVVSPRKQTLSLNM